MIDLRSALERYLSMRKGLGYKYQHQTRRLADFVFFMEKREAATITTKLALEWATLPPDRHASWALRLSDVRGFARHVANLDPRTEVPPADMLPSLKRAKPYVYSDSEIDALLAAALALAPEDGLRRWTYHTLFGLIAVTGMRLSEAMGLEHGDVTPVPKPGSTSQHRDDSAQIESTLFILQGGLSIEKALLDLPCGRPANGRLSGRVERFALDVTELTKP